MQCSRPLIPHFPSELNKTTVASPQPCLCYTCLSPSSPWATLTGRKLASLKPPARLPSSGRPTTAASLP